MTHRTWTGRTVALTMAVALCRAAWATNEVAGHFVDLKANGGWCWFQDPRAIVDNGQLIFGSIAGTTNAAATAGDVQVSSYNFTTGLTTVSTLSAAFQSDDHDAPALTLLPDGRYMAIYQKHGSDNLVRWRITSSPGSTASWGAEVTGNANPLNDGNGNTYANPFYLSVSNQLYSFSRSVGYDTNYSVFTGLNPTNDSSLTYNYGGHFLVWNNPKNGVNGANGGAGRPYVKYASDGVDTIWFTTTEDSPDNYWNSIYAGYIKFNSAGAGTVYKADGTLVGPLSTTSGTTQSYSPQTFTKIFDGTTNSGNNAASWVNSMQLDSSGHPYAVFSIRVDNPSDSYKANSLQYYYTRFDGASWQTNFLAYAGTPLYSGQNNYAGLAALDPTDPSVVFISTNYTPDTDVALPHYEIYQGTTADGGITWTWTAVTSNSTVDNIRPFVPDWSGIGTRPLLWLRGTYTSYTNYSLDVVGTLPLPADANYWNNTGNGDWDATGNWTVAIPNAAASAVFIGNGLASPVGDTSITIRGTKTVGSITFDDARYGYSLISGTAGVLAMNNGVGTAAVIAVNRGSHTIALPVTFSNGLNVSVASAATLTLSGPVTGSGGVLQSGAGTLVLAGANTYSGSTTIAAGILRASAEGLSPNSNLIINGGAFGSDLSRAVGTAAGQVQIPGGASGFNAGDADVNITLTSAVTWGSATFNPSPLMLTGTATHGVTLNADIDLNGAARAVQSNGGANTLSGVLSGTAGSLSVTGGSSALVLSNSANSYGGGTTIGTTASGVVRAVATHALGTGAISIAANGNASTGRLELLGDITLANAINLFGRNNDSVAIESLGGNNTLSGQITMGIGGTRYWIQSDAGTLALTGITSAAGNPSGGGGRTITLRGAGNGVVSGVIQNGTTTNGITLVKDGPGVWTLSGTNTYSGGTTVNAGALIFASAAARPGSGALTINASLMNGLTDDGRVAILGASASLSAYVSALKAALGTGSWNGSASIQTTSGSATRGLGYMSGATWLMLHAGIGTGYAAGYTVGANDILIRYTYMGDADLDGIITLSDYAQMDAAFLQHLAGPAWANGDFNYDGAVDYRDYALIDAAFINQSESLAADDTQALMQIAADAARFGPAFVAAYEAAVPEPMPLALVGLGAAALLRRRR